jgi:prepilin-type N-terminal cleavage/methylation domain-containing protein
LTLTAARRTVGRESGFTLIELMVAMPLMLIVIGGLTLLLTTVTHWSSHTQEQTALQSEARAAVSVLANDLRGAFTGDGTNPITAATATSMTFTTPDQYPTTTAGAIESSFHLQQVSYQVTGGMLQREVRTTTNQYLTTSAVLWAWGSWGPWVTVLGQANSITNPTAVFTYYTQAGAQASPPTALTFPIADTGSIRAVGVKLTLSTGGSQPQKFTVSDIVALRAMDN